MILAQREETFVDRHVLQQRIIKQACIIHFELGGALDNAFPLKIKRGVQVDVALDEVRHHFIKDCRLHPLVQKAVFVSGLDSHSLHGFSAFVLSNC